MSTRNCAGAEQGNVRITEVLKKICCVNHYKNEKLTCMSSILKPRTYRHFSEDSFILLLEHSEKTNLRHTLDVPVILTSVPNYSIIHSRVLLVLLFTLLAYRGCEKRLLSGFCRIGVIILFQGKS